MDLDNVRARLLLNRNGQESAEKFSEQLSFYPFAKSAVDCT